MNTFNKTAQIDKKAKLRKIIKYTQKGYFQIDQKDSVLAIGNLSHSSKWKKRLLATALIVIGSFPPANGTISPYSATAINPSLEIILPSGIIIYGNTSVAQQLTSVVNEFPTIQTNQGIVNVPKEEQILILLKPNMDLKLSKIYPLSLKNYAIINKTFNEIHK